MKKLVPPYAKFNRNGRRGGARPIVSEGGRHCCPLLRSCIATCQEPQAGQAAPRDAHGSLDLAVGCSGLLSVSRAMFCAPSCRSAAGGGRRSSLACVDAAERMAVSMMNTNNPAVKRILKEAREVKRGRIRICTEAPGTCCNDTDVAAASACVYTEMRAA